MGERPLSTYVVVAVLLGLVAFVSSESLLIKLFSLVYIAFAFFFQNKVWQQIMEMKETFVDEDAAPGLGDTLRGKLQGENAPQPTPSGKLLVPRETVQAAFKKVFLEDLIVLAFFLVLLGVFAISLLHGHFFGMLFFWVAFGYSLAWYCCRCCAGTVRIAKDDDYMLPEASAPP